MREMSQSEIKSKRKQHDHSHLTRGPKFWVKLIEIPSHMAELKVRKKKTLVCIANGAELASSIH